jgi:Tim10/DDP family zinc finger
MFKQFYEFFIDILGNLLFGFEFAIYLIMNDENLFGLYATVARLSDHCFRLCDAGNQSSALSSKSAGCIKSCVKACMETRKYVNNRLSKEVPEFKKYNKSLEFTSLIDFT